MQSPIKANGSKSVRGRQEVPARVLLICQVWISSHRRASCPSEGSPGFCSCFLPRRKRLLELLNLASVGTAPTEKASLLYCLLSWWHFAYHCWSSLEVALFQGLVFRNAFQCAQCIPAPAGTWCMRCSAPVHLTPLSFGDSSSNVHADFYMLVDLLLASVFLEPAALVTLEHVWDLHRLYSGKWFALKPVRLLEETFHCKGVSKQPCFWFRIWVHFSVVYA